MRTLWHPIERPPCGASPGVDCRSAMWQSVDREYASKKFGGIFAIVHAEWYMLVSTVELKSKEFLAVDSGACCGALLNVDAVVESGFVLPARGNPCWR
eukprot:1907060-Pyramimonas_sp.AAC.1